MATGSDEKRDALTPTERERLARLRSAENLADLVAVTGADSEHRAYFDAKREWYDLRGRELSVPDAGDGTPLRERWASDPLPGNCVVVDGVEYWVHGVTHADTDAERGFLREGVSRLREEDASVYCEQGIRKMYFDDFPGVCEMDDQRWAMEQCQELSVDTRLTDFGPEFDGLIEEIDSMASEFRDAVFSLIDTGGDVYGNAFESALGDVASAFLTGHADLATGDDFESYRLTREAAADPRRLVDLQRYYARRFLPQPVEREWLARHDRELELFTHARNERMVDYAVYHRGTEPEVHLIVGAAHQPGVTYYLERHREGKRTVDGFVPV